MVANFATIFFVILFFQKKQYSLLTRSVVLKYMLKLQIVLNENTRNIMLQNWRLLAILLSLPVLSMTADELTAPLNSQEIALDETAYTTKVGQKSSVRKKQEKQLPEEEAIRNVPIITPPVAPHVVDGTDTFVYADFIWWQTYIDGMEFAYSGVADNGYAVPVGSSTGSGHAVHPEFQYAPGIKAGFGWHFDHDGWDMQAGWTMLSSNVEQNSLSTFASSGVGMSSIQEVVLNNGSVQTIGLSDASSKWKQDFNVIDLELGRDFFLSRYLTMRPFAGLKSAWIHETTTNTYVAAPGILNSGTVATPTSTLTSYVLDNYQHLWGIGIRGGVGTGWHITKNWMLYGDMAFTNLWGVFHKSAKGMNNSSVGTSMTLNTSEEYHSIIPVIEAGFGVSYINWFADNRVRYELRMGWEEQVWLDYNRSQDFGRVGNLTVQGLTLKLMTNF
jgi:hypothetical protein